MLLRQKAINQVTTVQLLILHSYTLKLREGLRWGKDHLETVYRLSGLISRRRKIKKVSIAPQVLFLVQTQQQLLLLMEIVVK